MAGRGRMLGAEGRLEGGDPGGLGRSPAALVSAKRGLGHPVCEHSHWLAHFQPRYPKFQGEHLTPQGFPPRAIGEEKGEQHPEQSTSTHVEKGKATL